MRSAALAATNLEKLQQLVGRFKKRRPELHRLYRSVSGVTGVTTGDVISGAAPAAVRRKRGLLRARGRGARAPHVPRGPAQQRGAGGGQLRERRQHAARLRRRRGADRDSCRLAGISAGSRCAQREGRFEQPLYQSANHSDGVAAAAIASCRRGRGVGGACGGPRRRRRRGEAGGERGGALAQVGVTQ